MHPIERLRWVARSSGDDRAELARDAAEALAAFDQEPAGLVTACRRLLERHPRNGALWWLCARVLESAEPAREAWAAAKEIASDGTVHALASALPQGAEVLIIGWPPTITRAFVERGDVGALVGDTGDGYDLVRAFGRAGVDAEVVEGHAIGTAAVAADLVLIEADAMSDIGVVATTGSVTAAVVAHATGTPVWAVVPRGHLLPAPLWRVIHDDVYAPEPWTEDDEIVYLEFISSAVGPDGVVSLAELLAQPTCPVAPELLKPLLD